MSKRPLICPTCGAVVYPHRYGTSSFVCFNCESEVHQIEYAKRTKPLNQDAEKRNT